MSKQINTHLFFHMNTDSSSSSKQKSSTNESSTTTRKPKKSSNLFSGYEIDNNPPLPSETGDYYDYYTNYGIPDYYGPMSPSSSPPYNNVYNNVDQYNYYDYRNQDYYDYYNQSGERDHSSDYRDTYATNNYGGGGGGGGSGGNYSGSNSYHSNHHHQQQQHPSSSRIDINQHGPSTSGGLYRGPTGGNTEYLQPPLISPPIQDSKRASPSFLNDGHYGNDPQGLSAISHKLHRITFVEACIFNPPDLLSPSSSGRPIGPPLPPPLPPPPPPPIPAIPPAPGRVGPPPVLAQGERSPTSTGGTQYYQEWTSKHKRHLCSRFEKPAQQQLLMNVERKSKYPFIILCTPDSRALSKSSSSASSTGKMVQRYRREISQQSAYSLDDELDDEEVGEEEEDEANWITQKQRDSINSHYLPPPPPPLLMPHIWPEIRYIDGLYTVCASIVRPGSGVADDYDELYLGQPPEMNNYENSNNSYPHHPRTTERHISFQESQTNSNCIPDQRPTGYIVSGFATFPGEDSERLEKNWLQWTDHKLNF
ncbi:hypothetical protein BLOT_011855 [Blomia tropicalis]|nr:hypothetical protein BLOT_011855 [Blomia tropicalis]